jgi:hypothetical protein
LEQSQVSKERMRRRGRHPISLEPTASTTLIGANGGFIMPDYSDQIPPRDNKTLAIALVAAAAVILVLVIGVLFNTHNGAQTNSVNLPSTQSLADQPAKNNGG